MKERKVIDEIRQGLEQELDAFNRLYYKAHHSDYDLLRSINSYVFEQKGKQVRTLILLLLAKIFGKPQELTYLSASVLEMVHNASLLHDDVLDDADERRGLEAVHKRWSSKEAILAGDFLLSQGVSMAASAGSIKLIKMIADVGKALSEGELLQEGRSKSLQMTKEVYFDIIYHKTAFLIACCAQAGAMSVGASEEEQQRAFALGEILGIAFQLKDDILDYVGDERLGKPRGNDLRERKLTLPVIYYLSELNEKDRASVIATLKEKHGDKIYVDQLLAQVVEAGGVKHTEDVLREYEEKACTLLAAFPENEAKEDLTALLRFITTRSC